MILKVICNKCANCKKKSCCIVAIMIFFAALWMCAWEWMTYFVTKKKKRLKLLNHLGPFFWKAIKYFVNCFLKACCTWKWGASTFSLDVNFQKGWIAIFRRRFIPSIIQWSHGKYHEKYCFCLTCHWPKRQNIFFSIS